MFQSFVELEPLRRSPGLGARSLTPDLLLQFGRDSRDKDSRGFSAKLPPGVGDDKSSKGANANRLPEPGVWRRCLTLSPKARGALRLLKMSLGRKMPRHGHRGAQTAPELDGAYSGTTGECRRYDVQDRGDHTANSPISNRQPGCVFLIAGHRPPRFKGLIGSLAQQWTAL